MKKILMILIVGIAVILTSCNKDLNLDVKYQLTINIDNMDVVKNMKNYDNTDVFPGGLLDSDGVKVRESFFVYNLNGELVFNNTEIVDDFSKKILISCDLSEGEYTLVSCVDIVVSDGESITEELWNFKNVDMLSNFRMEEAVSLYQMNTLGVTKSQVSIDKSVSVDIKTSVVGAMFSYCFENAYLEEIAEVDWGYSKTNDYYNVEDAASNVSEQVQNNYWEPDEQYNGIMGSIFILPCKDFVFAWQSYSTTFEPEAFGYVTFDVVAGNHKTITVDSQTGEYFMGGSTKSVTIPSDGQILKVQSLPTEKIRSIH
ncbi:MAG: hypothetical protein WC384_09975 [Prolixibacteraceae bacterium]|jgi:hypothetical protein